MAANHNWSVAHKTVCLTVLGSKRFMYCHLRVSGSAALTNVSVCEDERTTEDGALEGSNVEGIGRGEPHWVACSYAACPLYTGPADDHGDGQIVL